MSLLLSVIIFFVATAYFFVAHIILVRNVNFYVKYFPFVDTSFLTTQHIFVLPVSIKNIVNKDKQMCSH